MRPVALALVLAACGGAPPPADEPTSAVGVAVETVPSSEDGAPRAHLSVIVMGGSLGAIIDLGEVGVDAESCAPTDPEPVDEGSGTALEPAREFACSGIHTGYRVALVATDTGVDVYTLLYDEEPGTWSFAGSLDAPAATFAGSVWRTTRE